MFKTKTKSKLISMLVALVMVLQLLPMTAIPVYAATHADWVAAAGAAQATTDYTVDSSGNLEIHTALGLAYFAQQVNTGADSYYGKTVTLSTDIDLSTAGVTNYTKDTSLTNITETNSWVPIGTSSNPFLGNFYGQNNTVSYIQINKDSGDGGLFGFAGGRIENLTVDNSNIVARRAGGIVAYTQGSITITNCTNRADVTTVGAELSDGSYVHTAMAGGIVGDFNQFAVMKNCFNYGTISVDGSSGYGAAVGGLVGAHTGQIISCGNHGNITIVANNGNQIGGIAAYAGTADAASGNITNSYNIGDITLTSGTIGEDRVGGIVGWAVNVGAKVINCYNGGTMLGGNSTGTNVGAVFGDTLSAPATEDTYYLSGSAPVSGELYNSATAKTEAELKALSDTLNDWVLEEEQFGYWWSATGDNFPTLSTTVPSNIFIVSTGIHSTKSHEYAKEGTSITIDYPTVDVGEVFTGWSGADDLVFTMGSKTSRNAKFTMPAANVDIKGTTAARTYTIKYNLNGGSGTTPTDGTATYDVSFTLASGDALTHPDGKVFDGWSLTSTGTKLGNTHTFDSNSATTYTLYAVWRDKHNYTITYYANSGGTGTMTQGSFIEGTTTFELPENGFTANANKYFVGWSLSSSGTDLKQPGENIDVTVSDIVYAIWKNIYTITYNANSGGSGTMADGKAYQDMAFTLPANAFTAPAGKKFKGWSLTAAGDALLGASHTFTSGGDTVYAIWQDLDTYTITYDANGGTLTMTPDTATENTPYALRVEHFDAPKGKIFAGWSLDPSGGTLMAEGDKHTFTADDTVYAIWKEAAAYTITFDANGGDGSMATATAYEETNFTLPLLPDFTAPTSKVFIGWSLDTNPANITKGEVFTADDTVYAIWENATGITVKFDANDGTGTAMPNMSVTEGEMFDLPDNTYNAPSGKVFWGWSDINPATKPPGMIFDTGLKDPFNTAIYAAQNLTEITLYAVWIDNAADKVHLSIIGEHDEFIYYNTITVVDKNTPVDVSSSFADSDYMLSYTADGSSPVPNPATFTSNTTLYLVDDTKNNYTLTIIDGGVGATVSGSYEEGSFVNITAGTRSGYTFNGWSGSGVTFLNANSVTTQMQMPSAHTTITANWSRNSTGGGGGSSTPDTPSEEAVDDIAKAKDGDTVELELSGSKTTVDKEVFEELAGKDITLNITVGGVTWTIHGEDIPEDADFSDIDFGVKVGSNTIPATVINQITGMTTTVQISIEHDGEFGFPVKLTVDLGGDNEGYYANLFYYNETADELEFRQSVMIPANGKTEFDFSRASDYVFLISERDMDMKFTDVAEDDWFYGDVMYVYQNGIMAGVSETAFDPNGTATRAMIATVLHRMEGTPEVELMYADFSDVVQGEWYEAGIAWAAKEEVAVGVGEGLFAPNMAITREQLVTMLYRYAGSPVVDGMLNYADDDSVSDWAYEAMIWAVDVGIIQGKTETTLNPKDTATRAEIAAIMHRFMEMK